MRKTSRDGKLLDGGNGEESEHLCLSAIQDDGTAEAAHEKRTKTRCRFGVVTVKMHHNTHLRD